MANFIKTAIITIIISFISGLLLEYYKNLAPRILCNIKNAMPIKISNKKICAYIITVSNVSNKTIHNLTLYIQSPHTSLSIADAKITKGLKFDSSIEDNTIDVHIPFLSKDDKFSVTVYAENQYEMFNKPVIILRSPENFKQIDSLEQNGILSSLLNIPKNIHQAILNILKKPEASAPNKKDDFTMIMDKPSGAKEKINKRNKKILHRNKRPSSIKKVMITIVSIILLVFVGVLGKSYFKGISASTPGVKTIVPNQSNDSTGSSGVTKNAGSKTSTNKTNGNANSKTSTVKTTGNTGSKTSSEETKGNTNPKTSTGETTVNTDSKTSTNKTNANTDSKTPTSGTDANTDSKTSTSGTNANTDSKTSTDETNVNTDSKASTGGTTVNTGSKASTGGTTENTGN